MQAASRDAWGFGARGARRARGQSGVEGSLLHLRFKTCRLQPVLLTVSLGCYDAKAAAGANRRHVLAISHKVWTVPLFQTSLFHCPRHKLHTKHERAERFLASRGSGLD